MTIAACEPAVIAPVASGRSARLRLGRELEWRLIPDGRAQGL
jgi:hypothetical protein